MTDWKPARKARRVWSFSVLPRTLFMVMSGKATDYKRTNSTEICSLKYKKLVGEEETLLGHTEIHGQRDLGPAIRPNGQGKPQNPRMMGNGWDFGSDQVTGSAKLLHLFEGIIHFPKLLVALCLPVPEPWCRASHPINHSRTSHHLQQQPNVSCS